MAGFTDDILRKARVYLKNHKADLPFNLPDTDVALTFLAGGEYNKNYMLSAGKEKYVLRVNIGTQINRDDQILYEFQALKLLEKSGVTPKPCYVDGTKEDIDHGILIMEYLPGDSLDYKTDIDKAAMVFAGIHNTEVDAEKNHLIREDAPLTIIYNECKGLLKKYFSSDLADPDIKAYLTDLSAWADENRKKERYFTEDPINCIVNTEVNSGNFIVDRNKDTAHLVDWEMPRWGDPTNDLAHFSSPFTTLWKTDYRMDDRTKKGFLNRYLGFMNNARLSGSIHERMKLREPYVLLRGISWSAMGYVAYQTDFDGVKNESTWKTLQRYMDYAFIRSVFDPVIKVL